MSAIYVVELNERERELHDAISWNMDELAASDYDARMEQLEKLGQLAESLVQRKAIPQHRTAYFTDPKMNLGGNRKSRKEVFGRKGVSGREIFRHPHFAPYLRYFIHGPNLPESTVEGFRKIIEEDRGTSGMVLDQIRAFVRKEIRDKKLSANDAAEEFFKLAYEFERPDLAESVRSAAKSTR